MCSNRKIDSFNCIGYTHPEIAKEIIDIDPNSIVAGSNKSILWQCQKCGKEWKTSPCKRTKQKLHCVSCREVAKKTKHPLVSEVSWMVEEWHPKNLDSYLGFTTGSSIKVWWSCKDCKHDWQAEIKHRIKWKNCPSCKLKNNSIEQFPDILEEFDYDKNDILPSEITYGSNKSIWWICKNNHSWKATPNGRVCQNLNCPYCSGARACKDNCFATKCKSLLRFWNYKKNTIKPTEITSGSSQKVWWTCLKKHEWLASISSVSNGTFCPYCSGLRVCEDNCLARHSPHLTEEWHPTKNNLTPFEVTYGSIKKIWWLGKVCKHEWEATVLSRQHGSGCSYCAKNKLDIKNYFGILYSKIALDWHPDRNNLTPFDVFPCSSKKYWWLGQCGHEWYSSVCNRTRGHGCPHCNISKGEDRIKLYLQKLNVEFEDQKRFKECRNKLPLPFDFCVKYNKNIGLIEYQGQQHFENIEYFGRSERFEQRIKNDSIKFNYCSKNDKPLLRIAYWQFDQIELMIDGFLECLKENKPFIQNSLQSEVSNWLKQNFDISIDRNLIKANDCVIEMLPLGSLDHSREQAKIRNNDLTIFAHEWLQKKDICKSIILSKLGKYKERIFARKCEVRTISKIEFSDFCDNNHLLGSNNLSKCQYGLFYNDILYGGVSLGRHHRGNVKDTLVLDRLCFKKDIQILGGANKLFKYCVEWAKTNNFSEIISWSDNRWSNGGVYGKMGFLLDKELNVDYKYLEINNPMSVLSKQSQKKSNTKCPEGMTELEWATERGLARIWDCGKKRWVFKV